MLCRVNDCKFECCRVAVSNTRAEFVNPADVEAKRKDFSDGRHPRDRKNANWQSLFIRTSRNRKMTLALSILLFSCIACKKSSKTRTKTLAPPTLMTNWLRLNSVISLFRISWRADVLRFLLWLIGAKSSFSAWRLVIGHNPLVWNSVSPLPCFL